MPGIASNSKEIAYYEKHILNTINADARYPLAHLSRFNWEKFTIMEPSLFQKHADNGWAILNKAFQAEISAADSDWEADTRKDFIQNVLNAFDNPAILTGLIPGSLTLPARWIYPKGLLRAALACGDLAENDPETFARTGLFPLSIGLLSRASSSKTQSPRKGGWLKALMSSRVFSTMTMPSKRAYPMDDEQLAEGTPPKRAKLSMGNATNNPELGKISNNLAGDATFKFELAKDGDKRSNLLQPISWFYIDDDQNRAESTRRQPSSPTSNLGHTTARTSTSESNITSSSTFGNLCGRDECVNECEDYDVIEKADYDEDDCEREEYINIEDKQTCDEDEDAVDELCQENDSFSDYDVPSSLVGASAPGVDQVVSSSVFSSTPSLTSSSSSAFNPILDIKIRCLISTSRHPTGVEVEIPVSQFPPSILLPIVDRAYRRLVADSEGT
ncbi:hypothetical protein BT96DRAFT_1020668 [Gymnopus androsaceus JB14]|uniref:Uncharacterized protein n=1 Tax=Gymnopus androsaceus JB14 TaxID=1447944 RepID=A0A6A4HJE0_9AGAR|nr:hypothetical protein BT96DRAFT_1020668 [Gymnopus androsaceus JB14]